MEGLGLSERRACLLTGVSPSVYRYEAKRGNDDELRTRMWSCPDLVDSQWFDMLNARSIPPLKGNWGIVVDGGMATVGVVPALDVLEYGHASLGVSLEGPAVPGVHTPAEAKKLSHRALS